MASLEEQKSMFTPDTVEITTQPAISVSRLNYGETAYLQKFLLDRHEIKLIWAPRTSNLLVCDPKSQNAKRSPRSTFTETVTVPVWKLMEREMDWMRVSDQVHEHVSPSPGWYMGQWERCMFPAFLYPKINLVLLSTAVGPFQKGSPPPYSECEPGAPTKTSDTPSCVFRFFFLLWKPIKFHFLAFSISVGKRRHLLGL